jgi:subtilisin family serine protease
MKNIGWIAATLLCGGVAFGQVSIESGQPSLWRRGEAAPNRYIVRFKEGTPKAARAQAALAARAAVRFNYDSADMMAVTVPGPATVEALRRHGQVVDVLPDRLVWGAVKPVKGPPPPPPITFSTEQLLSYEVQRVGVPAAGSDGSGVGVAVLDTGIDFNHPDLKPAGNTAATAFNALTPGASCQDDGGHGTHVSGLIAAQNNAIGIVGVAPAATLYCVKVLASDITGLESDVLAGLDWVVSHRTIVTPPIRVVNMSFGRPLAPGESIDSTPMLPFIQTLYDAGVVVVVSAGNDPSVEVSQLVPAGYHEVLAVGGTQGTNGINTCDPSLHYVPVDAAWQYTTDGAFVGGRGVTTSAPAEERTDLVSLQPLASCVGLSYGVISTTLNTGGTTRKLVPSLLEARGTSFSAPLAAGAVARVIQKKLVPATGDSVEVEGIRSWIRSNADRQGVAPLDHPWGALVGYTFDGEREGIVQAPK